jgi:hypothetical protein
MRTVKRVLRPERLRLVPKQFSWVDQALVQHGLIDRLDAQACSLYLFLVTVADAEGLSYYGGATLAKRLHLSEQELQGARAQLIDRDLIAYHAPLYQVLSLGSSPPHKPPGKAASANANPPTRPADAAALSPAQLIEMERSRARL